MAAPFGIYFNSPFCRQKCVYCDFHTYTNVSHLAQAYAVAAVEHLRRVEIGNITFPEPDGVRAAAISGRRISSIYFGGGNPALIGAGVRRLVDETNRVFEVAAEAEITCELNPEDARADLLREWRAAGVNRVSLGWQTLDNARLRRLGRGHSVEQSFASLKSAREAGFENVSVDLIFGLPGQELDEWGEELDRVITAGPNHISTYMMTISEGTAMAAMVANGRIDDLPEDDSVVEMYHLARRKLKTAGYRHYEISNFARPGRESVHNLNHWRGGEYVGIGAGAHSHISGRRWWTTPEPQAFIRALSEGAEIAGNEMLSTDQRLSERIILGLRLIDGLDPDEVGDDLGVDVNTRYSARIAEFVESGLMKRGKSWALTEKGLSLANEVMVGFV